MSLMPIPAPRKRRRKPPSNSKLPSALELLNVVSTTPLGLVSPFMTWAADLKTEYPPEGQVTYRNLRRQVRHRIIYNVASLKNQRMVACESFNEQKLAYLLEAHPHVKAYVEQPFILKWKDASGIRHKHIPDFLVKMKNGEQLVIEVKPDNALDDMQLVERTKLLSQILPAYESKRYVLVTSSQIELNALENARTIKRFSYVRVDDFEVETIRVKFSDTSKPMTFEILVEIAGIPMAGDKIKSLIRVGMLGFDMNRPFNSETVLSWIGDE